MAAHQYLASERLRTLGVVDVDALLEEEQALITMAKADHALPLRLIQSFCSQSSYR